ncbi:MAG: hypothetical protein SangKO_024810 [Sandaracinaceae bacterium]
MGSPISVAFGTGMVGRRLSCGRHGIVGRSLRCGSVTVRVVMAMIANGRMEAALEALPHFDPPETVPPWRGRSRGVTLRQPR